MSEPGEGTNRIKVVDRRRFDEAGDLRPDRPVPERQPAAPSAPEEPEPVVEMTPAEEAAPEPRPTSPPASPPASGSASASATSPLFIDLIAGLAQQAEMLITGGQGLPAQPAEAQRVIEYLSMLETKTKGNVSAEEAQVLSNVIFQLRALYVQSQK